MCLTPNDSAVASGDDNRAIPIMNETKGDGAEKECAGKSAGAANKSVARLKRWQDDVVEKTILNQIILLVVENVSLLSLHPFFAQSLSLAFVGLLDECKV